MRLQIITLYSQGKKPRQILTEINRGFSKTNIGNVRSTICYYRKRARTQKCFYTGQPAEFPSVLGGKIIYVCARVRRLEISFTEQEYIAILQKKGFIVSQQLAQVTFD